MAKKIDELGENSGKAYIPLIFHLQILINFWDKGKLEPDLQSDHHSLQWYSACEAYNYVLFKKSFKNTDLSRLIEAVFLSKFQAYIENISILTFTAIHSYYVGDINLNSKLFQIWRNKLQQSPKDIVDVNKRISDFIVNGAESVYANKIHEYTSNSLVNKDYFMAIESPLLLDLGKIKQFNISYMYDISIPISNKYLRTHNFVFSKLELLKFCSHLAMISHPKLSLEMKNLSSEQQQQYNIFTQKILQNEGYTNSEGMIIKSKVYKNYNAGSMKLEIVDGFIICLLQARERFAEEILKINSDPISDKDTMRLKSDMEHELKKLEDKKKLVSSFGQFPALALISTAISEINNSNVDKIDQIQRLVKDCFNIAYVNEGRFKNEKLLYLKKLEHAFELSGSIVNEFLNSHNSFILQVINSAQDHAFYIAVKNIFYKNKFQIMIVNGGDGLNLHEKDPSIARNEYQDPTHGSYRVMGSELFDKKEYKEFLQHYIYKALIFSHTSEVDKEKNIYLLKNVIEGMAKFSGFNGASFDIPKGLSLDLLFRAQTSDNCTIHNLKNCIRHLLDMSISEYAVFESELLKGADKMIARLLKGPLIETVISDKGTKDIGSVFSEENHVKKLECDVDYMSNQLADSYMCTTNEYSIEYHDQDLYFNAEEIINPIDDFMIGNIKESGQITV